MRLKEYLQDSLIDDPIFMSCAEASLHNLSTDEIFDYVKEASKLNARLQDLRNHIDIIDWWLDNGEDVSIRDLIDTLTYLEETEFFD